eukprot:TRINITY_DN95915_c0_g1_i1.p1 TRINITY_DN95915_c0_g1~~TRINITY_DN95915_c0_g1_i1.p1  ORF type:complete len:470 (+),score=64.56 TRINITY_DN95915_c0_g1_i1:170-1411(+)
MDAHFLEADVSIGKFVDSADALTASTSSGVKEEPKVISASGAPVIMAHYPTARSSDLTLEGFMATVLWHNSQLDAPLPLNGQDISPSSPSGNEEAECDPSPGGPQKRPLTSPFSEPVLARDVPEQSSRHPSTSSSALARQTARPCEEAAAFALDLSRELDLKTLSHNAMVMACIGARRDSSGHISPIFTRKGVKLDFKMIDCVKPTLLFLRDIKASRKLGGHLWLNADIFAGPGYPDSFLSPMDAFEFVRLCAELVPDAVLSLSWGSSFISTSRRYTDEMVDRMIELCMSPMVPSRLSGRTDLPDADSLNIDRETSADNTKDKIILAPAASCQHITFAVAAEYALGSAPKLLKLLDAVPGSSLTIFSGMGSLGISPSTVQDLITMFGKTRCFLDLRVTKPCRSCSQDATCSLQ